VAFATQSIIYTCRLALRTVCYPPPLHFRLVYSFRNILLTRLASIPVLGPETAADEFTIGGTIQSKKTSLYLNIATASTSYKPLVWGTTGDTTAWGLEGDTIITVQSSSYGRRKYFKKGVYGSSSVVLTCSVELNFLVCKSAEASYFDLYLQTGSDTPSGRTCSNYQTIHLPCLC
jgi:hypothetical protein